jgi:hypothetical protein
MFQSWKVPHILKGMLTWVPALNTWRLRHASTGGSNSPRYCYSVWLRHLTMLDVYGFKTTGAQIGELGPGDSIGAGLAALLSGASRYVGLDIVPFSARVDLRAFFDALVQMYIHREPIPEDHEFPRLRPILDSYEFPAQAIDWTDFTDKADMIRDELRTGMNSGRCLSYRAPWSSANEIAVGSLDLVFSQAVLEHVDDLAETYHAMAAWLKPGGYASHLIDFGAHYLSPHWNGHWAYSDWEWRLVRGCREFLLNREPLSAHLACAKQAGFEVLLLRRDYTSLGLSVDALSPRFRAFDVEDLRTRGAVLILRKPVVR